MFVGDRFVMINRITEDTKELKNKYTNKYYKIPSGI